MKKKPSRNPGIKTRTVYREASGRFAIANDFPAIKETWKYRTVKGTSKIVDIVSAYISSSRGEKEHFPQVSVPQTGYRMGRLSYDKKGKPAGPLDMIIKTLGVSRHDTRVDISMSARTKSGKIVKRKISFYHYNSKKFTDRTVSEVINRLFYAEGDRPAYPVKIVKNWRKRSVTKKETMGRRQLYDVTFNIKTDVSETRKQAARRIAKAKPMKQKIEWGMDLTKNRKGKRK